MLRKIRQILALVFFVSITLLFLDFTGTIHTWLGWMAENPIHTCFIRCKYIGTGFPVFTYINFRSCILFRYLSFGSNAGCDITH